MAWGRVIRMLKCNTVYLSRHPALSMYQRLTHKPWASYGHALGLLDWRLISMNDCVGTLE